MAPSILHRRNLKNGGFTLKTHQMFSVHTTLEEFQNTTVTSHFGFVFEENLCREITPSFLTSSVFKMFSIHPKNEMPAFSISAGLKNIFQKFCFQSGLVWTVGIAVSANKAAFQISPA